MSEEKSFLQITAEGTDKERSVAAIRAIGMIKMGSEIGIGIFLGLAALGFFLLIAS